MDRARLYVDFNEMLAADLVLLSKTDEKTDSAGHVVTLREGMHVHVYMEDADDAGARDNLIAEGTVERNVESGWASAAKWCCRVDARGIRHESDERWVKPPGA